MKKIAVVIQRFGREIVGGSELYALRLLEKLSNRYSFTVYTTCALDYLTWANHYPSGESRIGEIRVIRFPVRTPRNIDLFNHYMDDLFQKPSLTAEEEREWFLRQGPYSPELVEAVEREQEEYDLFLFFTYLYYPVVESLPRVHRPRVLIPTTHRERPLFLETSRSTFTLPEGVLALTDEERALMDEVYPSPEGQLRRTVGGIGIEPPEEIDLTPFLERHRPLFPYITYLGRIDEGKGVGWLVEKFREFAAHKPLQLLLVGQKNLTLPKDPRVRCLGYLSEEEKWQVLKGATLYVHPSRFESLSISMLEAMAVGTPVLVNGESPVMLGHALKSRAGLYYKGEEEFREALGWLLENPEARERMGRSGREYVRRNYSWKALLERVTEALEEVMEKTAP